MKSVLLNRHYWQGNEIEHLLNSQKKIGGMRQNFILMMCLLLGTSSFGQKVDFNGIITPLVEKPSTFAEYLVQLAWLNTPIVETLDYQVNIAEQEIKNRKLGWSSAVGINLGLTQNQAIDSLGVGATTNFFSPRVSVGATINILPLLVTPGRVKIAREKLKIAKNDIDFEKLKIRAEVMRRFEVYRLALEILKVRTQMNEDATSNYKLLQEMFKNDRATFKDYNDAYIAYYKTQEEKLEAKTNVEISIISIEELIGIEFEEARRLFEK